MFIAGREKKAPRLLQEIAALQGLQKRDITRLYNKIRKLSKTDPAIKALVRNKSVYKANELEMLPRFCNQLGLTMMVENAAREILEKIHNLGDLAGRQPATLAGVAIHLAAQKLKMELDPTAIGRVVGKAAQTILSAAKRLGQVELSEPKSSALTPNGNTITNPGNVEPHPLSIQSVSAPSSILPPISAETLNMAPEIEYHTDLF